MLKAKRPAVRLHRYTVTSFAVDCNKLNCYSDIFPSSFFLTVFAAVLRLASVRVTNMRLEYLNATILG